MRLTDWHCHPFPCCHLIHDPLTEVNGVSDFMYEKGHAPLTENGLTHFTLNECCCLHAPPALPDHARDVLGQLNGCGGCGAGGVGGHSCGGGGGGDGGGEGGGGGELHMALVQAASVQAASVLAASVLAASVQAASVLAASVLAASVLAASVAARAAAAADADAVLPTLLLLLLLPPLRVAPRLGPGAWGRRGPPHSTSNLFFLVFSCTRQRPAVLETQ
jgi:hypothetical protein